MLLRLLTLVVGVVGACATRTTTIIDRLSVNSRGLSRVRKADIALSAGDLNITFAKRVAGAAYSVTWRGHEVVPELEGNGGSLQTALAFDIPVGESPEVENPTEAGSVRDNYGSTSSRWRVAAASDDSTELYTKSQLAYWIPPGMRVGSSDKGTRARGSSVLSDVVMRKRVRVGTVGKVDVADYRIKLEWTDESHWFTQVQVLAVYLSRAFDELYVVSGGRAVRQKNARGWSSSPPDVARPIILAKSRDVAVGIFAYATSPGKYKAAWMPWYIVGFSGGHKDRGRGLERVPLTATGAVFHAGDQLDDSRRIPTKLYFRIALYFGSVDDVADVVSSTDQDRGPLETK